MNLVRVNALCEVGERAEAHLKHSHGAKMLTKLGFKKLLDMFIVQSKQEDTELAINHFTLLPFIRIDTIFIGWMGWVARQLATTVLWVRIQTSLKNHKWAT